MAYNVSEHYRDVVYSGGALYDCHLYIDDTLVPIEQISSIKISSPIIDTSPETGKMFHIGTFISQKLDIKFRNLDGLNLSNNPEIELEIGMMVDGNYEYVPIGKYLIDELGENYQKTCLITCLDYAVKFKSELDISQFFNQQGFILASDLFNEICDFFGVTAGTIPNVNNGKQIYMYDSSISGKQYIMYLAELFGGNAKIDRNGVCNIVPLNNVTDIEIDALTSKKFEVGDTYVLSRVCYDNGKIKYQAGGNVISVDELPTEDISLDSYYYLTPEMKYYIYANDEWEESFDIKNTLYLRNENFFITQQEDIDNMYYALKDFTVTNIKCENRMDFSLDAWDIVKYRTDNTYYYTFYDNTINFNGVAMGTINVNIPIQTTEETTNIIETNMISQIRKLKTTINEQDLSIKTIIYETVDSSNLDSLISKNTELEQTVDGLEETVATKDEVSQVVEQLNTRIDGITNTWSETGGNNLIYYDKEFWNVSEELQDEIEEYTNTEIKNNSVADRGYRLNSGHFEQEVAPVLNGQYTISFNYIKLKPLATATVSINDLEVELTEETWTKFEETVDIDTGHILIQFDCDTDESFYITDILINVGDKADVWTQNPNETRTETVKIGKGIEVRSTTTDTTFKADADGARIVQATNESNVVAQFTDKGTVTKNLVVEETAEFAGLLFQKIKYDSNDYTQTWISSLL